MPDGHLIEAGLCIAAVAQAGIAVLNLFLIRLMRWKPELDRLPLLINEVFRVHVIFISFTVGMFAVLTWRFSHELASGANPLASWLAAAIGTFWAVRTVLQWTYYSHSHWRGDRLRTGIHWLLFFGYGAFTAVYYAAAFAPS
jgi:hypothetical protein